MSEKITFEVAVNNTSQFYGTLVVSKIQTVTVMQFLGATFKSPASVSNEDFYSSTNPWVEISPEISSEQVDASTFLITAKLVFTRPYTFNGNETLTFGINGNLSSGQYAESFILAADQIPGA